MDGNHSFLKFIAYINSRMYAMNLRKISVFCYLPDLQFIFI